MRRSEREALFRRISAATLEPVEQEVVYLRYVEQLPQDTITTLLDLKGASGARGLLQRCRRKLTRALRQETGEDGTREFVLHEDLENAPGL